MTSFLNDHLFLSPKTLSTVDVKIESGMVLLDAIVVELVVRSQCRKSSGSDGVSEEDLSRRIDPGLGIKQF